MQFRTLLSGLIIFFLLFSACKKNPALGEDPGTEPNPEPPIGVTEGLLSFTPDFPSDKEPITITFDASKGNGGLKDYTGDVYLYTGVTIEGSTQAGDWKYNKWAWDSEPTDEVKMKPLGGGKYSIQLEDLRRFYKVPTGEKIMKLAMLFRNFDGSKSGRNADGSDIFLPLYDPAQLHIRIVSPALEPMFNPVFSSRTFILGEELEVKAIASKPAQLSLILNGETYQTATNSTSISGIVKFNKNGNQVVDAKATASGFTVLSSIQFTITGEVQQAEIPQNAKQEGFTRLNNGTSVIMTLYAPNKEGVFIIGDFNDWKASSEYFMKRSPDGKRWWIQLDNLDPQKEYAYQFLVDGNLKIADPYSEKILDPTHDSYIPITSYPDKKAYPTGKTTGIVSVFQGQPDTYNWMTNSFARPEKNKLIIYELHLRDFLKANDFNTLSDTLSYLENLGVNALQLMPVNEFEGNSSWGYNPSFYFTPDKFYGTPNMLKSLIDKCHQAGMAVILDMVLNHSFGQSPMVQLYFDQSANKPSAENPWFNQNPTHPFNVGYDFNHESEATKQFTKNVLKFWMEEYKIDGFRFDLSKGFTQKNSGEDVNGWSAYDASRVAIWKDYNNYMKSLVPNNFYVILEHFADDKEEQELAKEGMMLWNNLNHSFNEASMGWLPNSNFSRGFYDTHGFQSSENLISYMESHDEERIMYKNLTYGNASGTYNIKSLATALKRQEMTAAFFFAIPGPKMIWQFGELGYDKSIDLNGRTGEKPVLWNYKDNIDRMNLYRVYSKLIQLKKNRAVFNTNDFEYKLDGAIKYIILKGIEENVFIVGNFDVNTQLAEVDLPKPGIWYNLLQGNQLELNSTKFSKSLAAGEYYVIGDKP
jgi:1,4-alpha-glucan branching enzyme